MQISDFLQTHLSREAVCLVAYEAGITTHFDAYIQQLWGEGRILLVAESDYREYAERQLMPALRAHGIDVVYCLCIPTAGATYRSQIEEALSDGALAGVIGMVGLGSRALFAAVREHAALVNLACSALLNELPPIDMFDACGDNHPCADAVFFDLDAIAARLHGDLREVIQSLETDVYARRADLLVMQSLGVREAACVEEAMREALPPRIPQLGQPSEDELAQLCEAYAWRAVAVRLSSYKTSFQTVLDYAAAGADFPAFPVAMHAQIMALILEAALELESLEISPEDCADHLPPKEMMNRTLQQILLADGVKFDWLKRADEAYEDRNTVRLALHTLVMNWDDFCSRLRPIADLLHAIGAQNDEDDLDPSLKTLWINAARFAPKNSFLRLCQLLALVEPSLYI